MKIALLLVMLLAGCAMHKRVGAENNAAAVPREEVESAQAQASSILSELGAYKADPLSAFEAPEIERVEEDIAAVESKDDPARMVAGVATLETDWDALLGLDEILQKEHVI